MAHGTKNGRGEGISGGRIKGRTYAGLLLSYQSHFFLINRRRRLLWLKAKGLFLRTSSLVVFAIHLNHRHGIVAFQKMANGWPLVSVHPTHAFEFGDWSEGDTMYPVRRHKSRQQQHPKILYGHSTPRWNSTNEPFVPLPFVPSRRHSHWPLPRLTRPLRSGSTIVMRTSGNAQHS